MRSSEDGVRLSSVASAAWNGEHAVQTAIRDTQRYHGLGATTAGSHRLSKTCSDEGAPLPRLPNRPLRPSPADDGDQWSTHRQQRKDPRVDDVKRVTAGTARYLNPVRQSMPVLASRIFHDLNADRE